MFHFVLLVIYDGSKENPISSLENVKQLMLSMACYWSLNHQNYYCILNSVFLFFYFFPIDFMVQMLSNLKVSFKINNYITYS